MQDPNRDSSSSNPADSAAASAPVPVPTHIAPSGLAHALGRAPAPQPAPVSAPVLPTTPPDVSNMPPTSLFAPVQVPITPRASGPTKGELMRKLFAELTKSSTDLDTLAVCKLIADIKAKAPVQVYQDTLPPMFEFLLSEFEFGKEGCRITPLCGVVRTGNIQALQLLLSELAQCDCDSLPQFDSVLKSLLFTPPNCVVQIFGMLLQYCKEKGKKEIDAEDSYHLAVAAFSNARYELVKAIVKKLLLFKTPEAQDAIDSIFQAIVKIQPANTTPEIVDLVKFFAQYISLTFKPDYDAKIKSFLDWIASRCIDGLADAISIFMGRFEVKLNQDGNKIEFYGDAAKILTPIIDRNKGQTLLAIAYANGNLAAFQELCACGCIVSKDKIESKDAPWVLPQATFFSGLFAATSVPTGIAPNEYQKTFVAAMNNAKAILALSKNDTVEIQQCLPGVLNGSREYFMRFARYLLGLRYSSFSMVKSNLADWIVYFSQIVFQDMSLELDVVSAALANCSQRFSASSEKQERYKKLKDFVDSRRKVQATPPPSPSPVRSVTPQLPSATRPSSAPAQGPGYSSTAPGIPDDSVSNEFVAKQFTQMHSQYAGWCEGFTKDKHTLMRNDQLWLKDIELINFIYQSCDNAHLKTAITEHNYDLLSWFLQDKYYNAAEMHDLLAWASDQKDLGCFELLLQYGCNPNMANKNGKSLLLHIMQSEVESQLLLEFISQLFVRGADIFYCQRGVQSQSKGAVVEIVDRFPLLGIATEIFRHALRKQLPIKFIIALSKQILVEAELHGYRENPLRVIMQEYAANGQACIHWLVTEVGVKNPQYVIGLLQYFIKGVGLDLNLSTRGKQETALHLLVNAWCKNDDPAKAPELSLLEFLLANGASPSKKNHESLTIFDLVVENISAEPVSHVEADLTRVDLLLTFASRCNKYAKYKSAMLQAIKRLKFPSGEQAGENMGPMCTMLQKLFTLLIKYDCNAKKCLEDLSQLYPSDTHKIHVVIVNISQCIKIFDAVILSLQTIKANAYEYCAPKFEEAFARSNVCFIALLVNFLAKKIAVDETTFDEQIPYDMIVHWCVDKENTVNGFMAAYPELHTILLSKQHGGKYNATLEVKAKLEAEARKKPQEGSGSLEVSSTQFSRSQSLRASTETIRKTSPTLNSAASSAGTGSMYSNEDIMRLLLRSYDVLGCSAFFEGSRFESGIKVMLSLMRSDSDLFGTFAGLSELKVWLSWLQRMQLLDVEVKNIVKKMRVACPSLYLQYYGKMPDDLLKYLQDVVSSCQIDSAAISVEQQEAVKIAQGFLAALQPDMQRFTQAQDALAKYLSENMSLCCNMMLHILRNVPFANPVNSGLLHDLLNIVSDGNCAVYAVAVEPGKRAQKVYAGTNVDYGNSNCIVLYRTLQENGWYGYTKRQVPSPKKPAVSRQSSSGGFGAHFTPSSSPALRSEDILSRCMTPPAALRSALDSRTVSSPSIVPHSTSEEEMVAAAAKRSTSVTPPPAKISPMLRLTPPSGVSPVTPPPSPGVLQPSPPAPALPAQVSRFQWRSAAQLLAEACKNADSAKGSEQQPQPSKKL